MYDLIYDFIMTHLINGSALNAGQSMTVCGLDLTFAEWLGHSLTITCMVLLFVCFVLLVRFCFKAVSNGFLGIGR